MTTGVSSIYIASLAARTHIEYQQGVGVGREKMVLFRMAATMKCSVPLCAWCCRYFGDDYPEAIAVSAGYGLPAIKTVRKQKAGHYRSLILGSPALVTLMVMAMLMLP